MLLIEIFHIITMYKGADLLAGGDNYTYLQLGNKNFYPYFWDNSISLGGRSYVIPNLLGFPLYSIIFKEIPAGYIQRIILFFFFFLKLIGFTKLINLISKKTSLFAVLPATLLLSYNAFESLNPFSYFSILYFLISFNASWELLERDFSPVISKKRR